MRSFRVEPLVEPTVKPTVKPTAEQKRKQTGMLYGEALDETHPHPSVRAMARKSRAWNRLTFPETHTEEGRLWTVEQSALAHASQQAVRRISETLRIPTSVAILMAFCAAATYCWEFQDAELCAPESADVGMGKYWATVIGGLPLITTTVAFLFVFYANQAYTRYNHMVLACSTAQSAVGDLVLAVLGSSTGPASEERCLEVWRFANLMHLSCYVGMTHHTRFYSHGLWRLRKPPHPDPILYTVPTFLRPIAAAIGPCGEDQPLRGMLTDAEAAEVDAMAAAGDAHLLSGLFHARLYAALQESVQQDQTSVTWPVWGALLSSLRASCDQVGTLHRNRLPFIYRSLVSCAVSGVLCFEIIHFGLTVGRTVSEMDGILSKGCLLFINALGAVFAVCVVQLTLLISHEMADPLGHDHRDLPTMSYVKTTAVDSLRTLLRYRTSAFCLLHHGRSPMSSGSRNANA